MLLLHDTCFLRPRDYLGDCVLMRTPSALSLTAPPGTTGKATQPPILKRSPWPQAIPPRRAAWEGPQDLNP